MYRARKSPQIVRDKTHSTSINFKDGYYQVIQKIVNVIYRYSTKTEFLRNTTLYGKINRHFDIIVSVYTTIATSGFSGLQT